jgi:hypothetical protein
MVIGLMPSLDQQYNGWQNGAKHTLPNPTNNNIQPTSPNVPCYGYVPIKTIKYTQRIGPNGNIVKTPDLWKLYG